MIYDFFLWIALDETRHGLWGAFLLPAVILLSSLLYVLVTERRTRRRRIDGEVGSRPKVNGGGVRVHKMPPVPASPSSRMSQAVPWEAPADPARVGFQYHECSRCGSRVEPWRFYQFDGVPVYACSACSASVIKDHQPPVKPTCPNCGDSDCPAFLRGIPNYCAMFRKHTNSWESLPGGFVGGWATGSGPGTYLYSSNLHIEPDDVDRELGLGRTS